MGRYVAWDPAEQRVYVSVTASTDAGSFAGVCIVSGLRSVGAVNSGFALGAYEGELGYGGSNGRRYVSVSGQVAVVDQALSPPRREILPGNIRISEVKPDLNSTEAGASLLAPE
jgi:hypothetical protein